MNERSHAVVIGAGMAGLLAARALIEHFARVTIVERDTLPDGPAFRMGVPQSHHTHAMMPGGRMAIESLLPGFESDLIAAGAALVRWPLEVLWLTPAGWSRRFENKERHRLLCVSRTRLEAVVRRRVLALGRVTLLTGCEASGLTAGVRSRVTGVRLRNRGDQAAATERELAADLVVDASGRTSRAPDWLVALGYGRPQETRIDAFLGYATRQYAPHPGWRADWKGVLLTARPPSETRSGLMFPIEDGRWMVSMLGAGRDYPPTDGEGFLTFAGSLRDQVIHRAITDWEPLSPIRGYRRTENLRRHYERFRRWPDGFVVLGDAACTFNPIYAQGMSVAAQQTVALDSELRGRHALRGFAGAFQRRVAACSAGAWLVATGEDFRYSTTEGSRPNFRVRLTQRYLDRVLRAAMSNAAANAAFVDVFTLLRPPESLFHPRVVSATLGPRLELTEPPLTLQDRQ